MDMLMKLGATSAVVIFTKSSCCISHSIETLIRRFGANPTVYELDTHPNGKQMEKALIELGVNQLFNLNMDMVMNLGTSSTVVIFTKSSCCISHSIKTLIQFWSKPYRLRARYTSKWEANGEGIDGTRVSTKCASNIYRERVNWWC
ncbi:hypothetical protein H5410_043361 [Solanum commersonii]|uniref:Glutaredoxin domain-containing protein n=1 Tax=Solanum commersonii TaxID=4109 RepID=A0A9J5XYZ3_SOLCO|nr:hypothetical protein H5410_043361 [Solanum commersonii]